MLQGRGGGGGAGRGGTAARCLRPPSHPIFTLIPVPGPGPQQGERLGLGRTRGRAAGTSAGHGAAGRCAFIRGPSGSIQARRRPAAGEPCSRGKSTPSEGELPAAWRRRGRIQNAARWVKRNFPSIACARLVASRSVPIASRCAELGRYPRAGCGVAARFFTEGKVKREASCVCSAEPWAAQGLGFSRVGGGGGTRCPSRGCRARCAVFVLGTSPAARMGFKRPCQQPAFAE